jgi:hypothetical protein
VWRDNVAHSNINCDEKQAGRIYSAIQGMLVAFGKLVAP